MRALADPSADDLLRRGRAARTAWLALGVLLVGVGFVGIFVPLLPTTDFMLLALPCFTRSSPRFEAWLLNHPRFGPSLRAWRAEHAVPRHAKVAACIGMTVGYAFFWWRMRPGLQFALTVAVIMAGVAVWIISRPAPGSNQ